MVSLCGFYVFNPHVVLLPVFFFVLCCSIDPVSPCEVIKIVSNSRRLRPVEEGDVSGGQTAHRWDITSPQCNST